MTITIVPGDELPAQIDRMIKQRGYPNRSGAILDLARKGLRKRVSGFG